MKVKRMLDYAIVGLDFCICQEIEILQLNQYSNQDTTKQESELNRLRKEKQELQQLSKYVESDEDTEDWIDD